MPPAAHHRSHRNPAHRSLAAAASRPARWAGPLPMPRRHQHPALPTAPSLPAIRCRPAIPPIQPADRRQALPSSAEPGALRGQPPGPLLAAATTIAHEQPKRGLQPPSKVPKAEATKPHCGKLAWLAPGVGGNAHTVLASPATPGPTRATARMRERLEDAPDWAGLLSSPQIASAHARRALPRSNVSSASPVDS